MLLICWNVAGWSTTMRQIKEHYGSLRAYLDRHGADILCIQEAKLLSATVQAEAGKCGAADAGWHAAWSLYRPGGSAAVGGSNGRARAAGTWNGVATFAREGLLASADASPLGDPDLDVEGRCLRTDHGAFVLFNVYVPANGSGGCTTLAFKMRFLRALRRAMQAQRAAGRAVVLAGDLNLARRPEDVPYRDRLVDLRRALGEDEAYPLPDALRAKLRGWREGVRGVLASLRVREPDAAAPARSGGGAWTVTWEAPGGRTVTLARLSRESSARRWGAGDEVTFPDPDDPSAPPLLARRGGAIAVGCLADIVTKALGQPFPEAEQRALAAHGGSCSSPCLIDWANALQSEDGMVDTFAALHPGAQERFTCWEQYTNARYENDGARIDYVFVDAPLFHRVRPGAPLATGGREQLDPLSAEAAASAATAGGKWKMAPFDGSGIPDATMTQLDTQFEPPGTGIRYMPPPYSDHTAITLLLEEPPPEQRPPPLKLVLDAATKLAMPHKQMRKIGEFFKQGPPPAAGAGGSGAGAADDAAGGAGPAPAATAAPPPQALLPAPAAAAGKKRAAAPPPLPPGQKSMKQLFGGAAKPPPQG